MVFGWGKKKKEEIPVKEVPLEKDVHLSDVLKIVADLRELRKSQTISEIKHLRNGTEPLIEDLIKIGNVLEKDNLQVNDIDKHLAIIVVRGKKQVIDIIKKGVTPLPQISSINDAENLGSSLGQILKKVGDVLGRQTRVIHIFAKKYASQLKENLEIMNSNHAEILKLLKNYNSTEGASDEIAEALKNIDSLKKNRIEKNQKILETKNNLESFGEKILSLENSIQKIKSSENYKKYVDLKNALDSFGNQKQKIKNEINTQFTKISRPLSRYEYGSSLDKDQKNILTKLVEEPFDVLLPRNKDSVIVILENVRKGISSGSISVKDVDKSLSYITETEECLDLFVSHVSEFIEKHQRMTNDLKSLRPEELTPLENDLKKNIAFKDDSKSKSKTLENDILEINSKIPQLVSEIEAKLRRFSNTRYSVISSEN